MRPASKYLIYTVYTLIVLFAFLYWRFPSDLVENLLIERIEKVNPDVQLATEAVALTPPVGIKLDSPMLAYTDIPVIRMDHFRLRPQLISLFRNKTTFLVGGAMGDGKLSGRVENEKASARAQTVAVLNFDRVQLDYIEFLDQWPAFLLEGLLDAIIKYDSAKLGGTADISAEIRPMKISLEEPLMGIEALEFTTISAQLTLTPRMLQIRNCDATGVQLDTKLKGSVVFRQPLENSRLTLSLTVKPQPTFVDDHKGDMIGGLLASDSAQKRGLVFRISGTLANPRYVIR